MAVVASLDPRSPAIPGVTPGSVRAILRLEGAAAFAASATLYAHAGFSWPVFAVFFLAPDLAMLGYLMSPRIGAAVYNIAHTYALALPLVLLSFLAGRPTTLVASVIESVAFF